MNIPLKRYWDLLISYLKPQKKQFVLLTILLLGSILLKVLIPQITRFFIDTALAEDAEIGLEVVAIVFIIFAIMQQVVSIGATYVGENVAWVATNNLRADLLKHSLKLDMRFHNETSPGAMIERVDGDVTQLANFFSQLVIKVFGNLLLVMGILIALYIEDIRLGFAFTIFAGTMIYALNRVRGIGIPFEKALREINAEIFGFIEERLSGTEDVRSSGAVQYVLNGLYKLQTEQFHRRWKAVRSHFYIRSVAWIGMTLGYALAFLSSYWLFRDSVITIGTAYLVIRYMGTIARPIRELSMEIENLQKVGASIERIEELRTITSNIQDGTADTIPDGALAVEFDHVTFSYRADEPVLNDIDFHLQPGTIMGLLGRTGSGKTTLARLIFRLYDIDKGKICLGNTDITQNTLQGLRQRVAMVTQDVQIFEASVRNNLTFFDSNITDDDILRVIDQLKLSDWFETLPNGLETRLETGGRSLSAGEAQLLAFTRVFLHDPGLVILDEASSRVDPATERRIDRAMEILLQDRTGIIIAHRLGTVQRADKIMILGDGEIQEFGDRVALANDSTSRFAHLLQTGIEEVLV